MKENEDESACWSDSLIDPEPCFKMTRQQFPEAVTTTDFDKLSDQDINGAEAILTALVPVKSELIASCQNYASFRHAVMALMLSTFKLRRGVEFPSAMSARAAPKTSTLQN